MRQPEPEFDLLARYRDGDAAAFGLLVEQYRDRLLQFFFRLCRHRALAEDLAQDVFCKLLARVGHYREQGKLSIYIFRVATNLWIDHLRRQSLRPRLCSYDQAVAVPGVEPARREFAAPVTSPVQLLVEKENIDVMLEAIGRLGAAHRCVLELGAFQQLPYAEISAILGIPTGTVKSRMHTAIATLKELLDEASGRRAKAHPTVARGA